MESYLAFGLVSAAMLIITIIFYTYKNWLDLRKNAIYIRMLYLALLAVCSDILVGLADRYHYDGQYLSVVENFSEVVMSVSIMVLYMHI